ncbi:hypothetical protein C8R48DRAFT_770909 [Suillus tomentosus]|nr:hypothetical protein C8R48DRAFT_770909 [Suillus tomentosus]
MAHRWCISSESSSLSESDPDSDFSLASSRKTSSTLLVEKSAPSTEPFKKEKCERKSSGNHDYNKTKGSKGAQLQKQDNEEPSYPGHTQGAGEIHPSGVQQVVITSIRATDLALGLRWIPAGFHAVVKADGAEYQTSNKSIHIDQAVVEWHEHILLPRDPSSKVRLSIYASFELGPMLCHRDLLHTFEISVGELLDRSERSHPIIFQPKQEDIVSACTSLFMMMGQGLSDPNDGGVFRSLITLTSHDMDNSTDLDQSINHFEWALDLCSANHSYRPAALFNLATAKFIHCQANTYLDFDIPISLFQDALDLRPTGHPDRPTTQLHLAISLLSRFAKQGFPTDAHTAEELLSEVFNVCHTNSHLCRAALMVIETSALHGSMDANAFQREQLAPSMLPLSLNQLVHRAEWCLQRDELCALDEVISLHYDALGYYNTGHTDRGQLLVNLALMLQTRFERRGNDKYLDQAIALQTEALALRPVSHTDQSGSLSNLATQLSFRFHY